MIFSLNFHETIPQDSFAFPLLNLNMFPHLTYSKDFNDSYVTMIPKPTSLALVSPLNKFTHPNVHRLLSPACPILHVSNYIFFYSPYFNERHLSHQVAQIRNFGATLDFSLTKWLNSVDFISILLGSFISSGLHDFNNGVASYVFLTGLCASSLFILSNLPFHTIPRVIFLKQKSDWSSLHKIFKWLPNTHGRQSKIILSTNDIMLWLFLPFLIHV